MSRPSNDSDFETFFRAASDLPPFPYQRRLAEAEAWPARIEVPTGLGKTLAVVVAWLWRRTRTETRSCTPRRLVYCLPMRVLVEQTRDVVRKVVARVAPQTSVVVLMGGVDDGGEWDTRPEDDAIIIGTQDMLLSRALNRGYGMSRYRWPLHFGLLNSDCLWTVDEVQLVGSGVATTAQLQGLRRKLGTALLVQTSWMSATLEESWLRTVDVEDTDVVGRLALEADDLAHPVVAGRVGALKAVDRALSAIGDLKGLAREIIAAHRGGTRTLVVLNTVDRARDLFELLRRSNPLASLVLLHSRFRATDRDEAMLRALAPPTMGGTIVVTTQVIEAGVDVTSATLFTEIAPWASLVQRFGRCNRRGEDDGARVVWISLPSDGKEQAKVAKPYEHADLIEAQQTMSALVDAAPRSLPKKPLRLDRGLVLRRRDLLDLFDTTPDLAGNDVDVSRFIREADEHDVGVFWRDIAEEPAREEPSPTREELCSSPVAVVREWLKRGRPIWSWDGLRGRWTRVDNINPGMTLLLRSADGGYDAVLGLDPKGRARVAPVVIEPRPPEQDREYDGDPESEWRRWYTLTAHSDDVAREAQAIAMALGLPEPEAAAVVTAGRWHDAGKAHPVWQAAAKRLGKDPPAEPVAKSLVQGPGRITYEGRPGFRHELASALLALQNGQSDLVSYLIACHHGKVRLSIRSLPTERAPRDAEGREDRTIRHARGVWEGDALPEVDLGGGLGVPATTLTLRYMELGDDDVTGPSWLARALALRDDPKIGPFRLGFLEALVKCADERASRAARGEKEKTRS